MEGKASGSASAALAVFPRPLYCPHSLVASVPAWEVSVSFQGEKEAPHPFDYRAKLEQANLESSKLKSK